MSEAPIMTSAEFAAPRPAINFEAKAWDDTKAATTSASAAGGATSSSSAAEDRSVAQPTAAKWDREESFRPILVRGSGLGTHGQILTDIAFNVNMISVFDVKQYLAVFYIRRSPEEKKRPVPYSVRGHLEFSGAQSHLHEPFCFTFPFSYEITNRDQSVGQFSHIVPRGYNEDWPATDALTIRLRWNVAPALPVPVPTAIPARGGAHSVAAALERHVPFDYWLVCKDDSSVSGGGAGKVLPIGETEPLVGMHGNVAKALFAPLRSSTASLFADAKSNRLHLHFGVEAVQFLVNCIYRGLASAPLEKCSVLADAYALAGMLGCDGLHAQLEARLATRIASETMPIDQIVALRSRFPDALLIERAHDEVLIRGGAVAYARFMESKLAASQSKASRVHRLASPADSPPQPTPANAPAATVEQDVYLSPTKKQKT